MSTTYTVTNTFTADTTAVASEANQNFTDVLTALNAFDASNLSSGTVPVARISNLTATQIAAATLVIEAEGIGSNDNDTTWPTCAAVKDFVDTQVAANVETSTLATKGQTELPGGLQLKWGSVSIGGSGTASVDYTDESLTDFGTASLQVFCSIADNSTVNEAVSVTTHSITGLTIRNDNGTSKTTAWFAIGY